jgi:beta-lactamase class A
MISISDNTAADALIRLVGTKALAPYADSNRPFLTTREMFTLKSVPGADLRAAYLAASTPRAREAILARADQMPLPAVDQLLTTPALTIEWHYSVRTLCRLISRVAELPLMSINPGGADPAAFRHIAFKGGSDIGVINLTTMLTTRRGTNVCFSATLNNSMQPVDDAAFEAAYAGVLHYLADE